MMQIFLDFLREVIARPDGDVLMAWVEFIPAALSLVSSVAGGVGEGKRRRAQRRLVDKMNAENETLFNTDYYSDYTQRADAQDIIRQMRKQFDREAKRDDNTSVVAGGTVEAQAAAKEGRNRAMSNLFGNLGAMGQRFKDAAKSRYLRQKMALQGMEYDDLGSQAQSANNLLYNGLSSLAGMDWANIFGKK